MNMLGNLGGFLAPVVGGIILQRVGTGTAGWNLLIDTMVVAAAVSAACWLYLDRSRRVASGNGTPTAPISSDPIGAMRSAAANSDKERRGRRWKSI
jgi:MFS family permease